MHSAAKGAPAFDTPLTLVFGSSPNRAKARSAPTITAHQARFFSRILP
jgi:hypothetical protein